MTVPHDVWAAIGPRLPSADRIRAAAACRDSLQGISSTAALPVGPCCDRVDTVAFEDVAPSGRAVEYMAEKIAATCEYVRERDIAAMLFVEEELLGSSYLTLVRALRKTLAEAPPPDGVRFEFRMPYRDWWDSEHDVDLLSRWGDDDAYVFDWDDRDGRCAVYTKNCSFDAVIPYGDDKEFTFFVHVYLADRSTHTYWTCRTFPIETFVFENRFAPAPSSMTLDRVCERVRSLLVVHGALTAAAEASSAARAMIDYTGDPLAMVGEKFYDPTDVFAEKRLFCAFSGAGTAGCEGGEPVRADPPVVSPCRGALVVDPQRIAPRPRYVFPVVHDMIAAFEYVHANDVLKIPPAEDRRAGPSYVPLYRAIVDVARRYRAWGKCGDSRVALEIPNGRGGSTRVDVMDAERLHVSKFDWTAGEDEHVERARIGMRFSKCDTTLYGCDISMKFYFDGGAEIEVSGPKFRGALAKGGRWTNDGVEPLGHPKHVFKRVRTMLTLNRILTTVKRSDVAWAVIPWVEPQLFLEGDGFHLENSLVAKYANDDELWRSYVDEDYSCDSCGLRGSDNEDLSSTNPSVSEEDVA